jgi:hypothetical protein
MKLARTIGSASAAVLLATLSGCATASAPTASQSDEFTERAADPTGTGPLATTSAEYRLPAGIDADIMTDRATEVWAQVYRPANLALGEKHPLVIFLHGNHGTCGRGTNPRIDDSVQYTMQGTCPAGYVVTPNHLGYAYTAERLASWGYVVVSINANRGITAGGGVAGDGGLNLARGRLVLKHLQLLSQWNTEPGSTPATLGVDLAGTLDFGNVGMMGHSRGGEGVRAAYTQYKDEGSPWPARIREPLTVKGIFEIGPVDGQTGRTLNALGTAWNVILPMCDGDVSNLQGMKPFDRMLALNNETAGTAKGMFAVWGANHNYYNTEWQQSDSFGCRGANHTPLFQTGTVGSQKQMSTGLYSMMGFFRAHVGTRAQLAFDRLFDPQFGLPTDLEPVTHIGRAYADAANTSRSIVLESFTGTPGTSLSGQPTVAQNVTVTHGGVPEHDALLRAANIKWTAASAETFLQIPWAAPNDGLDASEMKTLDLRVALQNQSVSSAPEMSFSVQLVNADDSLSEPVAIKDYVKILPAGHAVLETARIPLSDLRGANLSKVRGVKLVFNDTPQGAIFVSTIRFSRALASTRVVTPQGGPGELPTPPSGDGTVVVDTGNTVNALRATPSDAIEVELESATAFPVLDDLARLRVDGADVVLSRYADDGNTHRMVFTMSPDEFARIRDGATIKVRYGADQATREWNFGKLQKSALQR